MRDWMVSAGISAGMGISASVLTAAFGLRFGAGFLTGMAVMGALAIFTIWRWEF